MDKNELNECPVCKRMVESKVHCKHCNAHMEPELWYKDQPAPAPMPEEVERLFQSAYWGPMPKLAFAALREAFTALARRLAEVEGELTEEKRLAGLEADMLKYRAEAAEAKLQRIMEWARGKCNTCHNGALFNDDGTDACGDCPGEDDPKNWTPPKEWEGGE